jgi:hypothetical protein
MLNWRKIHPKHFFRRNNTTYGFFLLTHHPAVPSTFSLVSIAIDIGGATSVVCVLEDGQPKVIENIEGERTTPAYVAFEEEDVVGVTARRQVRHHGGQNVFVVC